MTGSATVVTTGRGLVVGGTQNQVTSTSAIVGPNALLASGSYPLPTAAGPGPLTSATSTLVSGFWRISGTPGSGQFTLPNLWGSLSQPYVYNNSASNLGGITGSNMLIDGYPVVAGTYVFQFMDLSAGTLFFQSGGVPVMFRGCRMRASGVTSPGFFNSQSGGYAQNCYFHFNDFGGQGTGGECDIAVQIGQSGGIRLLRNYISWVGSGLIPSSQNGFCDVIENLIENITLYTGSLHLNGIKWQGGDTNCLCLRNCVVVPQYDNLGNQITQTDCIAFIPTFGAFPGTGVNSDGSTGYFVKGNLMAGTGFCFYGGADGPISNLTLANNLWTSSSFPATGGANGPTAHTPTWGSGGNSQLNNLWADGPNVGQSVNP